MFEKKVKETKEVTKKKVKKDSGKEGNPWNCFGTAFTDSGTCGSNLSAYGEVIRK